MLLPIVINEFAYVKIIYIHTYIHTYIDIDIDRDIHTHCHLFRVHIGELKYSLSRVALRILARARWGRRGW